MLEIPGETWIWPSDPPRSGDVLLRAFRDEDADAVVSLARDPYIPTIGSIPFQASREEAADWIAAQRRRLQERAGFAFVIADRLSGTCVGFAGLWLRTIETGTATGGYSIVPEHRGRGLATSALRALTSFAWTRPPVRRVELHIEPSNTASRRAALRAGYREGPLLPAGHEIGGEMRDVIAYERTRPAAVTGGHRGGT